jgi:hypothetical protein
MTYVPHQLITGSLEHAMQGDRQLDDSEARADVATGSRADVNEARANLLSENGKLLAIQATQVRGGLNSIEYRHTASSFCDFLSKASAR